MLTEKLDALSQKSAAMIPKETLAKLGVELEKLQQTHMEEKTIKAGDKLPGFSLIDTAGNTYTGETFKDKKLVLNFFRGSW